VKYGRDNPWVLVNVFGRFPPSSLNTLIGPDECRDATRRAWAAGDIARAPRVLGVDVARFGDDASVIFPRQGLVALAPQKFRNIDGTQGAGQVARQWRDWDADACFIDDTGGFGSSWIDNLRRLGRTPIGVHFAGTPNNPRYHNKRTEMYFEAIHWIKNGGALPGDGASDDLIAALSQTTYTFRGDRLALEPKEQLKARLGCSPDDADAFALTFAQPVAPRPVYADRTMEAVDRAERSRGAGVIHDYDPLEEE
jgi:hypothetical protein